MSSSTVCEIKQWHSIIKFIHIPFLSIFPLFYRRPFYSLSVHSRVEVHVVPSRIRSLYVSPLDSKGRWFRFFTVSQCEKCSRTVSDIGCMSTFPVCRDCNSRPSLKSSPRIRSRQASSKSPTVFCRVHNRHRKGRSSPVMNFVKTTHCRFDNRRDRSTTPP